MKQSHAQHAQEKSDQYSGPDFHLISSPRNAHEFTTRFSPVAVSACYHSALKKEHTDMTPPPISKEDTIISLLREIVALLKEVSRQQTL